MSDAENAQFLPHDEPEQTQAQGVQEKGPSVPEVLPVEPKEGTGLRHSTVENMMLALGLRHNQTKEIMQLVGRGVDHELRNKDSRIDRLQDQLTDEMVKNARFDERLRTGQMSSGSQLFSASVGGTILGYGLTNLNSETWDLGAIACLIGVGMVFFGCLPTISARWTKKNG